MFLSLAMVAPLVSIGIVKLYGPELERGAYADLQTIVDLKAEQIELWLAERHGDAEAIAVSQAFIERVANMQSQKDGQCANLSVTGWMLCEMLIVMSRFNCWILAANPCSC